MAFARKVTTGKTSSSLPEKLTKRVVTGQRSYTLPSKPIEPPKEFTDYCLFLYGLKGSGKTSLAAQFRKALILMLEPRRRNLKIRQVPEPGDPALTWPDIEGYTRSAINEGDVTLVVDSLDMAYNLALAHYCASKGVTHPKQITNDYGESWNEIDRLMNGLFNQCLYNDIPLIFTSHAKMREDEKINDEAFLAPTCSPRAWLYAKQVCDFAFYLGYHNGKHTVTVRGNEQVFASCGPENCFLDPDGNPLTTFYLGESPQEAYKTIMKAYKNEGGIRDINYEPPREKKTIARK